MIYSYRKTKIYLLINQDIFDTLENLVVKHNRECYSKKESLKMDALVLYISLIEKQSLQYKDRLIKGFIPLYAKYLEDYQKNYKMHIEFLEKYNFIKRSFYKVGESSFGYKIIFETTNTNYSYYEPISFSFRKKIKKLNNRDINNKTKHLTKWLNSEHINFDYNKAIESIRLSKLSFNKKKHRLYCAEYLKAQNWSFSRKGKDNRLHTILTSLPKDLKQFITVNKRILDTILKSV